MARQYKGSNLSDKISSLISAAPDYGEEEDDLTTVRHIAVEEQSDSGDEISLAQFRKINIEFLDSKDSKYSGFCSSRREVDIDQAFASDPSDGSDQEIDTGSVKSDSEHEVEGTTDEVNKDQSDSDVDSDSSDVSNGDEVPVEYAVSSFSGKVDSDIEKGNAIRNQFNLWDALFECRIKFQKCLSMANKFPQNNKINEFKDLGGEQFTAAQKICQSSIKHVLNSLLNLQDSCLKENTRFYNEQSLKRKLNECEDIRSDSSIGSDSETFNTETDNYDAKACNAKRRKLQDFSKEIAEKHLSFVPFRNEIIEKWNAKTRVSHMGSKDFSAFEQSTLKQIEMVLTDKQRLLKRTRTKRSNYHVLGEDDEGPSAKAVKVEECSEIFDDDDFYHQLLRELLERKTSDVTDPVQLSRQWIQLQKERSKMKKVVDTKASKGRKLRYGVHQKLVNFMMPIDNISWSNDARTELMNSLFGKKTM